MLPFQCWLVRTLLLGWGRQIYRPKTGLNKSERPSFVTLSTVERIHVRSTILLFLSLLFSRSSSRALGLACSRTRPYNCTFVLFEFQTNYATFAVRYVRATCLEQTRGRWAISRFGNRKSGQVCSRLARASLCVCVCVRLKISTFRSFYVYSTTLRKGNDPTRVRHVLDLVSWRLARISHMFTYDYTTRLQITARRKWNLESRGITSHIDDAAIFREPPQIRLFSQDAFSGYATNEYLFYCTWIGRVDLYLILLLLFQY